MINFEAICWLFYQSITIIGAIVMVGWLLCELASKYNEYIYSKNKKIDNYDANLEEIYCIK